MLMDHLYISITILILDHHNSDNMKVYMYDNFLQVYQNHQKLNQFYPKNFQKNHRKNFLFHFLFLVYLYIKTQVILTYHLL